MEDKCHKFDPTFQGKLLPAPNIFNLTQFQNYENILYFENENPELKIIHSKKVDVEEIIVFHM